MSEPTRRRTASPLVEAFKPCDEFAFTETPLATDLESGQLFALDHTLRGSLGYLQRDGGLSERQKTQRIDVVFHRQTKLSNANAFPRRVPTNAIQDNADVLFMLVSLVQKAIIIFGPSWLYL